MSMAAERIAVFQDTITWISSEPDLSASVLQAKKATKVYYEDDYPLFSRVTNSNIVVCLTL